MFKGISIFEFIQKFQTDEDCIYGGFKFLMQQVKINLLYERI
jgi:hypothetical protein